MGDWNAGIGNDIKNGLGYTGFGEKHNQQKCREDATILLNSTQYILEPKLEGEKLFYSRRKIRQKYDRL